MGELFISDQDTCDDLGMFLYQARSRTQVSPGI